TATIPGCCSRAAVRASSTNCCTDSALGKRSRRGILIATCRPSCSSSASNTVANPPEPRHCRTLYRPNRSGRGGSQRELAQPTFLKTGVVDDRSPSVGEEGEVMTEAAEIEKEAAANHNITRRLPARPARCSPRGTQPVAYALLRAQSAPDSYSAKTASSMLPCNRRALCDWPSQSSGRSRHGTRPSNPLLASDGHRSPCLSHRAP